MTNAQIQVERSLGAARASNALPAGTPAPEFALKCTPELRAIDQFAKEGGIDLWRETSEL